MVTSRFLRARFSVLTDKSILSRYLPILFRLLAILLAIVHTWAAIISQSMNSDGIDYLDIGDAFMRGDWRTAISSVWSPMYSWLLGLLTNVIKPSLRNEFPVVQLINFCIYLFALICFEWFWRQMRRYQRSLFSGKTIEDSAIFPEWSWWGLGYSIFIFSSLNLIKIWSVTPDMLMSSFVYIASGTIVRVRMGDTGWRHFVLLGSMLGLSYLTKAIMFPVAIVFLLVCLFTARKLSRYFLKMLAALLFFLVFSLPFITVMSVFQGRLVISDVGKLTYAWFINGVPYPHWQGVPAGNGTPVHPSRLIFEDPPIYEFGSPVGGTYPISLNPSYWYEGLFIRLDLERQFENILYSLLYYFDVLFHQQAGLAFGVLLLYGLSQRRRLHIIDIASRWGLVIIALTALAFYSLVLVNGRYIGAFVVLLWADLLANVNSSDLTTYKRFFPILNIAVIFFLLTNIFAFNLQGYRDLSGMGDPSMGIKKEAQGLDWPGKVAEELHSLGIQQGDKVAIIGYGFDAFWARLARVQIVAEMLDSQADGFWTGDHLLQSKVIRAFAGSGARAVVAENVPSYASLEGWHQVGDSNYYIYPFNDQR